MENLFSIKNVIKEFMDKVGEEPLVLYGAGKYGKYALENIRRYFPKADIRYFVDDNLIRNNSRVENVEVVSLADAVEHLGKNFYILITNFYVTKVLRRIEEYGFNLEKVFFNSEILIQDIDEKYVTDNIEKLRSVYEMLCDYQSKLIYKTMIEAHYTRNIDVLSRTCGTIQYFSEQDILNFGTEEVFVDAGAFDGDTVEQFINVTGGKYKYIYAFEPDTENFKNLKKKNLPNNIKIFNAGLFNKTDILCFSANKGGSSKVQSDGENKIQVYRFDELNIPDREVSFVKMDIEGSELKALKGMEQTILKYKPKLAICIYHKFEDLWELPLYIKKLVPEYKLYIRNYTTYLDEIVLYATI